MLPVIPEFLDGLLDVVQGQVCAFLAETGKHPGHPAPGQFLQGTDIQVAVMEIVFQGRHASGQEPAVLTDTVAAHG